MIAAIDICSYTTLAFIETDVRRTRRLVLEMDAIMLTTQQVILLGSVVKLLISLRGLNDTLVSRHYKFGQRCRWPFLVQCMGLWYERGTSPLVCAVLYTSFCSPDVTLWYLKLHDKWQQSLFAVTLFIFRSDVWKQGLHNACDGCELSCLLKFGPV